MNGIVIIFKRYITIILFLLICSSCNLSNTNINATETRTPTLSKTISPTTTSTITSTITFTPTPQPVQINQDNFTQFMQTSNEKIDQSQFVGYTFRNNKLTNEDIAAMIDGTYWEAGFVTYMVRNDGEVFGFEWKYPTKCKDGGCRYSKRYTSMVNLTGQKELWTVLQPLNPGGEEFEKLLQELKLEGFKAKIFSPYNNGPRIYSWSSDQRYIVIPIVKVNSIVIKEIETGENIFVHNGLEKPCWIGKISPDGTKIALIEGGLGSFDSLLIYDISSQELYSSYSISRLASDIAWANNGNSIAIARIDGKVSIIDLLAKEERMITGKRTNWSFKNGGVISRMIFSPDDKKIAYVANYYDGYENKQSFIVIMDLESGKEINSVNYSDPEGFNQNGNILWSQDSDFIVSVTDNIKGNIIFLSEENFFEYPLDQNDHVEDYYSDIFSSQIYFNEEQTQLKLIRSIFDDAFITTYEITK